MFESYKQFTRMGTRKQQFKSGDMKRFENYLRKYVIINYDEIVQETPRATLFLIDKQQHWLPKSVTTIYIINNSIEIPMWLALKRGFQIQNTA